MAELVLGLGVSHSPQVSMVPEAWPARGEHDKNNPALIGTDGIVSNYEDLLNRADVTRIAKEITPEKFQQRFDQNQQGVAKVVEALYGAKLDVLAMVGDDQQEYLQDDNMPGFSVYWGDDVIVKGRGISTGVGDRPLVGYRQDDQVVPTHSALGQHIIQYLVESEYDVACSKFLDPDRGGSLAGRHRPCLRFRVPPHHDRGPHSDRPHHGQYVLPAEPADTQAVLRHGAGYQGSH